MRVIVSMCLENNYRNYTVVNSFRAVRELSGVQCLIVHRYTESDFDAGVFISEFHRSGIKNFLYISKDASVTMKMVLGGVNGVILDDEFYFDDEEELDSLLEEMGVNPYDDDNSVVSSSLSVISDFMQSFARGEDKVKTPIYLESVNSAIQELCETTHQQELQIKDMGISAVSIFEKASNIITNMDKQRKVLEQKLQELEEFQQNQNALPRNRTVGSGVMFFPPYKYTGSAKVLLIRELSPCRYLTSFALAYHHHVHFELNKRIKLIFVHQKGAGVSSKYDKFTSITQESMQEENLYNAPIVATNNPKSEVLKELTHRNDEVIVIVDRLYGSQDIANTRVVKVNAISGMSDLDRFKVKSRDCIFTTTAHPQGLFCIPHIKQYPADVDTRYATYNQVCKDSFAILDSRLQL